jgi:hypothetical protein
LEFRPALSPVGRREARALDARAGEWASGFPGHSVPRHGVTPAPGASMTHRETIECFPTASRRPFGRRGLGRARSPAEGHAPSAPPEWTAPAPRRGATFVSGGSTFAPEVGPPETERADSQGINPHGRDLSRPPNGVRPDPPCPSVAVAVSIFRRKYDEIVTNSLLRPLHGPRRGSAGLPRPATARGRARKNPAGFSSPRGRCQKRC